MDRASSLIYPGSKTLAGWWRQLQPRQPHAIQVGYAFVHRIEAPVQVRRSEPIDACACLILQAVALELTSTASVELDALHQRLRLPVAVLQQMLADLTRNGLLTHAGSAGWQLTEMGRAAIPRGSYEVHMRERQVLAFIERLDLAGQRSAPPHFLPLAECAGVPWQVEESHRFELASVKACIAESADWKRQWTFPDEIEALTADASQPTWQEVIIDRPDRLLLVVARLGAAEAEEWQGFAVKPEGWHLHDQAPILRLPVSANVLEVGLAEPPAGAVFQDAWRAWCRERNLPANEVELCALTHKPPRLEVRAPERLVQRLRAAKNDLLRGEAWILVGDGYFRTAALLTLT